ncbi:MULTISPECIES: transporter substrate-binding domain-containing protein [unclassified Campylobacter]|uniref:transporter substrate-binding domain-containing protein n=1 Tax=unclassified Campylobacter TaxID=2593542 RepID=UPI001BD9BE46|nr:MULTISPECIES: transporter substrate-binding domain-containing protein [unclassified Campylobacter]MBZ7976002.1 transporter substrate-binding domain-containing protein [Campylobacter sp. RM12637]MBZ7977834.1 transporter substrate-binding domain-containing protein [Campylobacter sp. RM12654]MBZ7979803.1 transporter substrate-binding domain-containing protein [Campylobacter sp. RM12642]MBZ7982088.1 transporter substrate-binding domain-containing protein [Campylobacter sp. RM12640]MBZ7983450.1 
MKKLFLGFALVAQIFAQDILKVGTSPGYAPFEYMKDGKIVGFDMDLVEEIAKILDIKVEFVAIEFDGLINALKAGKIDVIASGMNETPQRAKSVDFSNSYYNGVNYYVKLKENTNINSLEDLSKGAKLGAQLGTLQADEVSKIKGVKPYLNSELIVFVLATVNKKIDGFVLDAAVAKGYINTYPELSVFAKTPILGDGVSFAFAKGNTKLKDDFNNALKILKDNGTYVKLLQKYDLDN